MFDARALSRAGARGLMQLMPDVARPAARAAGIDSWNDDLLDDPSVNLKLGVAHLASLLKDYDDLPRVLAAYNAGRRRADQWSRYPGAKDPEVFTEWVPFDETRGYILAIQRNRELYRALYDWAG
jgi:soluble lytic murein transglycosylase